MRVTNLHILVSLFIFLILTLVIKPRILSNLYSSLLGRIILILVVLFFAMNNVTLGLLSALTIIIASNMFLHEGLDNMDSNISNTTSTNPSEDKAAIAKDIIKEKINKNESSQNDGIDLETIKASIQPKASSSLPLPQVSTNDNIAPASTEPFTSMYAPF